MNQKKLPAWVIIPFTFYFIPFTLISCDLFNAPKDSRFIEKIDEEIAWANADRLTVIVAIPEGWGASPQTVRIYDAVRTNETPRKGYPFNVEFTPNSGFGFIEWLAFNSDDFSLPAVTTMDFADAKRNSLNGNIQPPGATMTTPVITHTGAIHSAVTVHINVPVMLVPFCDTRPRVIQSNPPLLNSGFFFTRSQQITLWFSMELDYEDGQAIDFTENGIMLRGHRISNGQAWDGLNGDLTQFYHRPVYHAADRSIIILPLDDNPPPENLTVTVSAGTGITANNSSAMAAPAAFSFRINDEVVSRAYKASNVWAVHDPDNARVGSFFFQTAPEERDRRLRRNDRGYYEVTLYFSISRSMGEITDPAPDMITIAEIYYASLAGEEEEGHGRRMRAVTAQVVPMEDAANSAGGIYRQMNPAVNPLGVHYYRVLYEFDTEYEFDEDEETSLVRKAGIYRLAVLPWQEEGNPVTPDDWETAVVEGRFVTVVIDDEAPGGNGALALSGQHSIRRAQDGGLNTFNYNPINRNLGISAHFSGIQDNDGNGILLHNARPNLPWTMDDQRNLQWQWRIDTFVDTVGGEEVQGSSIRHYSDWLPWGTDPQPLDISRILAISENRVWTIEVRFKDVLDNESDWEAMGKIRYIEFSPSQEVENVRVEYIEIADADAGTIKVFWLKPAVMEGVQLTLIEVGNAGNTQTEIFTRNDHGNLDEAGRRPKEHDFPVPAIDASGIRDGIPAKVTEYRLELRTFIDLIAVDSAEPVIMKIWNIPGMIVTEDNPVVEITNENAFTVFQNMRNPGFGLGSANRARQYILTGDILISYPWVPIGSDSGNAAFQGKFYGNGKKIVFDSSFTPGLAFYGIFGAVENAIIRDLVVEYTREDPMPAGSTTFRRFGGIAGSAFGSSVISNCIVQGTEEIILLSNLSGADTWGAFGGILGWMEERNGSINNCLSAIAINIVRTSNGPFNAGGLVGFAGGTVNESYTSGNMTAEGQGGNVTVGGLAGETRGIVSQSWATGDVNVTGTGTSSNSVRVGGLVGNAQAPINQSWATGSIDVTGTGSDVRVGGLVGETSANVSDTHAAGSVSVTGNNSIGVHVGGLAGRLTHESSGTVRIERSYATGAVTTSNTTVGDGGSFIGGLLGHTLNTTSSVEIVRCYATGNVSAISGNYRPVPGSSGTNSFVVGGLVGRLNNGNINQSWASGNVTATQTRSISNIIQAGGLIGLFRPSANNTRTIANCYALGDVLIDYPYTPGARLEAGGLAGNALGNVRFNFATGKVRINSGTNTSNTRVYAGGVLGMAAFDSSTSLTVGNNVALGESITVSVGSSVVADNRLVRRVIGSRGGTADQQVSSNNHGLVTIQMGSSNGGYDATVITNSINQTSNTSIFGADVTDSRRREASFWTGATPAGVAFSGTIWDTTGVADRGYPLLRGVGGQ